MPRRRVTLSASAVALSLLVGAPARVAFSAPNVSTVWSWGGNAHGELGSSRSNNHVPASLSRLAPVEDVAGGGFHALALLEDGTVWAWGDNANGQLGDGTTTPSLVPRRVPGLTGITAISAGSAHSLAFRESDGKLWAWGSNESLQLGAPDATTMSAVPIEVAGLPTVADLVACGQHNLVLDDAGTAWAWGENFAGQLGDGTTTARAAPGPVNLANVAGIGCGFSHSIAFDGAGAVFTWGLNSFGQLGQGRQDGPVEPNPTPAVVGGPTDVVQVEGGTLHCLARTSAGEVWAWGYNTEGQVGNGAVTPANTGVLSAVLLPLADVVDIAAGGIHSVAVDSGGQLWAWGANLRGALGNNRTESSLVPLAIAAPPGLREIDAGANQTFAVADVRVAASGKAAGLNDDGQLGDGTVSSSTVSVSISSAGAISSLACGDAHSLALFTDGSVAAWGSNSHGQLGFVGSAEPTPTTVGVPGGDDREASAIAAGSRFSLALRSDGTVWAWGDNSRGQLGDGTMTPASAPQIVTALPSAIAIAAGDAHALAVTPTGDVWAWGDNQCGQLGLPLGVDSSAIPTRVAGVGFASHAAAGGCFSLARRTNGVIQAWGDNRRGQLGDDSLLSGPQPRRTSGLSNVTTLDAGTHHALAVAGGRVWAWGDPSQGQLGNGSSFNNWTPVLAAGPDGVVGVAAGGFHSAALGGDGSVWTWGDGVYGQLAVGTTAEAPVPSLLDGMTVTAVAAGRQHTLIATP